MKIMNELTSRSPNSNCLACGTQDTFTTIENDTFAYGAGSDVATISVCIPVHHCRSCGLAFTGEEASELRHEAVCAHLGVMTPRQIRGIREMYGLTQLEFSQVSRIGKASLARWESGSLIQNYANDSLLYLLTFAENLGRLKTRFVKAISDVGTNVSKGTVVPFRPHFRMIDSSEAVRRQEEARKFELYVAEAA